MYTHFSGTKNSENANKNFEFRQDMEKTQTTGCFLGLYQKVFFILSRIVSFFKAIIHFGCCRKVLDHLSGTPDRWL
jgi:hypothetical protein